tara:strand:+ start:8571 stop:9395 length:825 start_codon:yes stop_codon:yes gene_type:complete
MRLYKKGGNEQNAYNQWVPGGQPYISWKNNTNNKTVVVSKTVKNDLPTNIKDCTNNCSFVANPIKHPRKQYVNLNTSTRGFSNQSYIGGLDKPGGTNITSLPNCDDLYQKGYEYILDLNDKTCRENCFITKSASTVIDSSYCMSTKELLWKKCKTFNQNLPLTTFNTNLSSYPDCSVINNCTPRFHPSNTKYQVQGPVSSSARIAAIKYCAQDVDSRRCYLPTTDYNRFGTTAHNKTNNSETFNNLKTMPGCVTCRAEGEPGKSKRYSNIRILK